MARMPIPDEFRRQAFFCQKLGSPLYEYLLTRCAEDYEAHGPVYDAVHSHEQDPEDTVLPLRLMGAVHRLVLEGHIPELAKFYPSAGGVADLDGAWTALRNALSKNARAIQSLIGNTIQTNEVGRSGSLLGGFATIAKRTHLPLRLLEIGASAGLNLRWDRYRYEWPGGSWGDPASAVRLENVFRSEAPSIPPVIEIVERAGCDLSPVDITSEAGRLTLLSYLWPDQLDRIQRLNAAIGIARTLPCDIQKSSAADWLEPRLRTLQAGAVTVVFDSVMWIYVSASERLRIIRMMEEAGNRATENAPLAWLRLEQNPENRFDLRLRIWPGFPDQVLAITRAHAPSVRWLLPAEA